ncbi:hypothetical protein Mmc1_0211 [Magnetococcus marinus MC-1]|uniref:Uncharacterized protein n=1 Tax=Magnetococcus marinus (strain ATCC BAA-1437 / JCM 17883 / MC-1) TaxID=156889 RepID=A0L445_MAGMM|nr:hypothetical protein [Magnetococcus marinus]ABK42738.1 hypothetical protein Mmc1_0211 [Magnetococcus marinus MC-1]
MDGYAVVHEGHGVLGAGQDQAAAIAMARRHTDLTLDEAQLRHHFDAIYGELYLLPATEALVQAVTTSQPLHTFKIRQFGLGWIVDLTGEGEDEGEEEA